jgi:hypothetical protein
VSEVSKGEMAMGSAWLLLVTLLRGDGRRRRARGSESETTNEDWWKRRGWWLIPVGFTVAMIVALIFIMVDDRWQRDDCRNRGGHVEDIQGSRYGGWVCEGAT